MSPIMWSIIPLDVAITTEQDAIIYTLKKQLRMLLEHHCTKMPFLFTNPKALLTITVFLCGTSLCSTAAEFANAKGPITCWAAETKPLSQETAWRIANAMKLEVDGELLRFLVPVSAAGHVVFVCCPLPDVAEELLEPSDDGIESPIDSNFVWVGEDSGVAGVCARLARELLVGAVSGLSLDEVGEIEPVCRVSSSGSESGDSTDIVQGIDRVDSGIAGLSSAGGKTLGL